MTGWFDNIRNVKVAKTGQYFKPGKYHVKIIAVKKISGQLGKDFVVIETKVLQSNNPEILVGSEKSHVIPMGNVMALPNIKSFVAAVSGIDPTLENVNDLVEDYWAQAHPMGVRLPFSEIVEDLIIGKNILEDLEMDLECVPIVTKEGNPFTKYNWSVRQD